MAKSKHNNNNNNKNKTHKILFISLAVIILIGALLTGVLLVANEDLAGMARKILPAYNEQLKKADTKTKVNLVARQIQQVTTLNQLLAKKMLDYYKMMKAAEICTELENSVKKSRGSQKISALCKDPDNDDFQKADGVYAYITNPNLIKGKGLKIGCNVVYDTCKEDGLPYLYEQRCNYLNVPEQLMYDCSIMGPNFVCKKGACVDTTKPKVPLCGDLVLDVGEECEDGNIIDGDGCSKLCKVEPKQPDLAIGQVFDVLSQYCVNSLNFEICNKGEGIVENNFMINVEANGKTSLFMYEVSAFGKIEPGKCVNYINPIKLNVLKFGKIDNNYDFKISVDLNQEIDEKDENNNEKTQNLVTGDNYYYLPNDKSGDNICDTWCFDTDEGKQYWIAGNLTFMHLSAPDYRNDQCDEYSHFKNKAILSERFCVDPIYKLDNGLFTYPAGEKQVDCTLLNAKCEDSRCVPIEKNNLKCKDYESGGVDPFKLGIINYTGIDSTNEEYIIIPDTCENEEMLLDYYCENGGELAEYNPINCYYLNAICQNGACVKVDKENQCIDNDPENDPFIAGNVDFVKFNGVIDPHLDDCTSADKTQLRQYYCINDKSPPQQLISDCTQYKNEFGPALCSNGKCTYPDPSLKKCIETYDNGLDYYKFGGIQSTNEYAEFYEGGDYCINDKQLIEFFCSENDLQMAPPYDCSLEGNKVCKNGACVVKDDSLKSCTFNGQQYEYTDEFGQNHYESQTACSFNNNEPYEKASSQSTDYLINYFCDGKELGNSIIDCTKINKKCFNGECMIPNPALAKCVEATGENWEINPKDPFTYGSSIGYNEFGIGCYVNFDNCMDSNVLQEVFCEGNTVKLIEIKCSKYGMKCNDNKDICQKADPTLASCTDTDDGNEPNIPGEVFSSDEFGASLSAVDDCDGITELVERTCENNKFNWISMQCSAGKQCRMICDADNNYLGSACIDTNDNTNVCKAAVEEPIPAESENGNNGNNGGGGSGP